MTHTTQPENQLDMDNFKITKRKGHHEPNGQSRFHRGCGCSASTSSGYAYRDKVAETTNPTATKWDTIRFYHQSPVVKKNGEIIRVNTHGHGRHRTTRKRINWELPTGFKVVQRDFEVKLSLPNGDTIDLPVEKFDIQTIDKSIRKSSGELICHYTEELNKGDN